jgi:protein-S-isoprenylcysteine O-methyltransferase Ste14
MHNPIEAAPIAVLWLAWLAYWIVAARGVKAVQRQPSLGARLAYGVPIGIGAFLLASTRLPPPWLDVRFLPMSAAVYWTGVALVAAGIAVMVWARRHLAGNWSGQVTLKHDHELIRTGPYRLVRHPIYTGLLAAILGTAIAFGKGRDLAAFLFIALGVGLKIRLEERLLAETFAQDHARYRAEVPALIPVRLRRRPPPRPDAPPDEGNNHGKT